MRYHASILTVIAMGALLASPALAQNKPAAAEKVAEGLLKLDLGLEQTQKDLDTAMKSLMDLTGDTTGNLPQEYAVFSEELKNIEDSHKRVRKQAEDAKARRENYFKQWQKAADKIQSPELKASAEARRNELAPVIEGIRDSLTSAGTDFATLLQSLKDINLFLGSDLSPTAITAAQPLATKCNENAAKVKADIDKGREGIRNLAERLKPASPAA